jgi:hypothetical protein
VVKVDRGAGPSLDQFTREREDAREYAERHLLDGVDDEPTLAEELDDDGPAPLPGPPFEEVVRRRQIMGHVRRGLSEDPVFWIVVVMALALPLVFVGAAVVHRVVVERQCEANGPRYQLVSPELCKPVKP